jgi:hypothetical protein
VISTKSAIVCVCTLLLSFGSYAQGLTVKGMVVDTTQGQGLKAASVSLIREKDSVLSTFTRAGADGSFELHPAASGKFILLITYPGFADYLDVISVKDQVPVDLGKLVMLSRTHLLQEVVVKRKMAAIVVKGDTTEYAADSFAVREGASVEELLKKLPGLQVDKDGKITAQGETVQKLLVDGEEFFSDDPAVVTKNLQAKTVDKVQVFDKKSDQAEFTGIDDGTKIKTVNLLLKENSKKGYFGKLQAGGGTNGYFDNQGMLNVFRGKRKLALFGIGSNTGRSGLGWSDRGKYGSGDDYTTDEESGYTYYTQSSDGDDPTDWSGRFSGEGLPRAWTGGLHYSNKWNGDKVHVSGNYRIAQRLNEAQSNTFTQFILPDSQYFSDQHRSALSTSNRQGGDGMWEWKPDSTSTFKATVNASYKDGVSNSSSGTRTLASDGALVNSNERRLTTNSDSRSVNSSFSYRKRFKKKGRTISAFFNESYDNGQGLTELHAINSFYSAPAPFETTVDQQRQTNNESLDVEGKLSYTEPLTKKLFLELNYKLRQNESQATRLTYDKDAGGDGYNSRNDLLSSDYRYRVLMHRAGTALRLSLKKLNASAGIGVSQSRFNQTDRLRDTSIIRDFTNLFPQASLRYSFSKQRSLRLNYDGYTRQPSISQIQPLRDNTDPLNVAVGNPALRQSFTNNLNLSFNDYKVISGRYIYANLSYNLTADDISRSESIDEAGRRVYQYVNVDGNQSGWFYAGIGTKIPKTDMRVSLNSNASVARRTSLVNGIRNESRNNSYGVGLGLDWDKDKKFNLSAKADADYNQNTATISTLSASYWIGTAKLEGSVTLPWKMEIGSEVNYALRQKTASFDQNTNMVRWDAYVSKKLLKGNALEARASVFDILNQNVGFSRVGDATSVVQNSYLTIRRYGLLSLVWHFSSEPVKADDRDDD